MLGTFWANAWHKLGMGIAVVVCLLALSWVGSGSTSKPALGTGLLVAAALAGLVVAAIGAAWLGFAWVSTRRALEEERAHHAAVEHALVSTTRGQRERLHELRSTIAGLVTGSELLDRPEVSAERRERLWRSVQSELHRMERLLSGQDEPATDLDLDEALGLILDLQQLKGRQVECHSNGAAVLARFDSLAEVLNILMDNAAVHGGTDSMPVAVEVDVELGEDQTVDIRVTDSGRGIPKEQQAQIFDWGKRGSDSSGEGIGLNLAQRLVTEDGGSLRLADNTGSGSSFVISLPAARRSPENERTTEEHHAWLRSS